MKPLKALMVSIVLGLASLAAAAGGPELPWLEGMASPRIEQLRKQVEDGDASAVPRFWEEMKQQHTPLVEALPGDSGHVLVTFLYQATGPTRRVALVAPLSTDRATPLMNRLGDSDLWYKTYGLRNDMRFSYSFLPNPTPETIRRVELYLPDPLNPKSLPVGIHLGRSALELPAAPPQPWIAAIPGVRNGSLSEEEVESKVLKSRRWAWVYTPAGYDPKRKAPYPVLVCFDGATYSAPEGIPVPIILDNLIAQKKIPPMMAVLIKQNPQPQRNIELSNNPEFVDFVADELLPAVRQKWRATADPAQTIVCGFSAGGLASAFAAFRRPDVFGNVLSQSGALWPGQTRDNPQHEWLTRQFESSPKLPTRFVLQAGIVEVVTTPLSGPSILEGNRHLRDVLSAKGYEVYYSEVAGGHEPLSWRGGLAEGLIQLMGKEGK